MVEQAIAVVILVAGVGGFGVGLAWLNDRRLEQITRRTPTVDPKRLLESRLAAGELDEAEFNSRMHALLYGPPLELGRPE
ncbi:MAG TPA: hypothetical protein VMY34_08990 [Acidimicrobiales bacterium]|nr:hypothetical protein [Acidimicrobiales bacterium]